MLAQRTEFPASPTASHAVARPDVHPPPVAPATSHTACETVGSAPLRLDRLKAGRIAVSYHFWPDTTRVVRIGRMSSADIVLNEGDASRMHAVIVMSDGGLPVLSDMGGGDAGTYVNGRSITEVCVRHGDRIQIGTTVFVVKLFERSDEQSWPGAEVTESSDEPSWRSGAEVTEPCLPLGKEAVRSSATVPEPIPPPAAPVVSTPTPAPSEHSSGPVPDTVHCDRATPQGVLTSSPETRDTSAPALDDWDQQIRQSLGIRSPLSASVQSGGAQNAVTSPATATAWDSGEGGDRYSTVWLTAQLRRRRRLWQAGAAFAFLLLIALGLAPVYLSLSSVREHLIPEPHAKAEIAAAAAEEQEEAIRLLEVTESQDDSELEPPSPQSTRQLLESAAAK